MWLSYLHSTVEMQPFSPNFPLAESIAKEFCWLFLCNFKEKSINHFLWHSLSELFQNHAHIRMSALGLGIRGHWDISPSVQGLLLLEAC